MPKYTVTIVEDGVTGTSKTVTVDTEGMVATVVQPDAVVSATDPQTSANASQGGKRSAPSFRLKKRRITRKLKKTR